jgi:crossover junction endodeoxyribonuclease RuvC
MNEITEAGRTTASDILGIDPGLSGALAFYNPAINSLVVWDVPTLLAGKGTRRVVDEDGLAASIAPRAQSTLHAFVERVGVMPMEGAVGAFSFGTTYGLLRMAVAAFQIPRSLVMPQVWKRALGVPAAKEGAIARASQLMPRHAEIWTVKRGHCTKEQAAGRSEAALIAYYGARLLGRR